MLLAAEAKLGELLAQREKGDFIKGPDASFRGRVRDLPPGIPWKESHQAQVIFRHPAVVERAKKRA